MWRPAEVRGSGDCVTGGVWLKACPEEVVSVVRPNEMMGRSRQGWGVGYQVE